jgi:uncharacterized protein
MARLRRSCHRLLWLDPLASRPGFAPATLGLQVALPHVGHFLPCANITSRERLGALPPGPRGRAAALPIPGDPHA